MTTTELADRLRAVIKQKLDIDEHNLQGGMALQSLDGWLADAVEVLIVAELMRQEADA